MMQQVVRIYSDDSNLDSEFQLEDQELIQYGDMDMTKFNSVVVVEGFGRQKYIMLWNQLTVKDR